MNMNMLRISQTYAQIGIQPYPAELYIRQTPPKVSIEQRSAELTIETRPAKVLIDQTQCFAEAGLKSPFVLTREWAERGRQDVLEAIGQIAEDGDRLMAIEKGGSPIADMAREKLDSHYYDDNIVFIPQSRPDIRVEPGEVNIEWKVNPPKIYWEIHTRPEIDATRPYVDIYMRRWPSIHIEYVGGQIDRRL